MATINDDIVILTDIKPTNDFYWEEDENDQSNVESSHFNHVLTINDSVFPTMPIWEGEGNGGKSDTYSYHDMLKKYYGELMEYYCPAVPSSKEKIQTDTSPFDKLTYTEYKKYITHNTDSNEENEKEENNLSFDDCADDFAKAADAHKLADSTLPKLMDNYEKEQKSDLDEDNYFTMLYDDLYNNYEPESATNYDDTPPLVLSTVKKLMTHYEEKVRYSDKKRIGFKDYDPYWSRCSQKQCYKPRTARNRFGYIQKKIFESMDKGTDIDIDSDDDLPSLEDDTTVEPANEDNSDAELPPLVDDTTVELANEDDSDEELPPLEDDTTVELANQDDSDEELPPLEDDTTVELANEEDNNSKQKNTTKTSRGLRTGEMEKDALSSWPIQYSSPYSIWDTVPSTFSATNKHTNYKMKDVYDDIKKQSPFKCGVTLEFDKVLVKNSHGTNPDSYQLSFKVKNMKFQKSQHEIEHSKDTEEIFVPNLKLLLNDNKETNEYIDDTNVGADIKENPGGSDNGDNNDQIAEAETFVPNLKLLLDDQTTQQQHVPASTQLLDTLYSKILYGSGVSEDDVELYSDQIMERFFGDSSHSVEVKSQ